MQWDPSDPSKIFVFVDREVTPYSNPSFLLYRMATEPAYRLKCKKGEEHLLIISVGTRAAESLGESFWGARVRFEEVCSGTALAGIGRVGGRISKRYATSVDVLPEPPVFSGFDRRHRAFSALQAANY